MSKAQLTDIEGIGDATAATLVQHGFTTVRALAEAAPESISAVPGFQITRAVAIQQAAAELLNEEASASMTSGKKKSEKKGKKKNKKGKSKKGKKNKK